MQARNLAHLTSNPAPQVAHRPAHLLSNTKRQLARCRPAIQQPRSPSRSASTTHTKHPIAPTRQPNRQATNRRTNQSQHCMRGEPRAHHGEAPSRLARHQRRLTFVALRVNLLRCCGNLNAPAAHLASRPTTFCSRGTSAEYFQRLAREGKRAAMRFLDR